MKKDLSTDEVEALLSAEIEIDRDRLMEIAEMLDVEYSSVTSPDLHKALLFELNQMNDEAEKILAGKSSEIYPELAEMDIAEVESNLTGVKTLLIELTVSKVKE